MFNKETIVELPCAMYYVVIIMTSSFLQTTTWDLLYHVPTPPFHPKVSLRFAKFREELRFYVMSYGSISNLEFIASCVCERTSIFQGVD